MLSTTTLTNLRFWVALLIISVAGGQSRALALAPQTAAAPKTHSTHLHGRSAGTKGLTTQTASSTDDQNMWLVAQMTPLTKASPDASLVRSYGESYAHGYGRTWVYDDALAAISLSLAGNWVAAEKILRGLSALIDEDGKLAFSHGLAHLEAHKLYRSGAIAWVGYAFALYHKLSGDGGYSEEARRIADYLLTLQTPCGTLRGGPDVKWRSTEHNIDAFFFFKTLAKTSRSRRYGVAAERIASCLLKHHFNAAQGRFYQGYRDQMDALDANTLGVLFLMERGKKDAAIAVLAHIERTFRIETIDPETGKRVRGYRPYVRTQTLWTEGTLQVAFAYDRVGLKKRASDITARMRALSDRSGGLRYAMPKVKDFSDATSVASTSWLAFASSSNRGQLMAR